MNLLRTFTTLVAALIILPLVVLVAASFTSASYVGFPPLGFSLRWYIEALTNASFLSALGLSLAIAIMTAMVSGLVGFAAGFGLVRYPLPLKNVFTVFLLGPLLVPTIVIGMTLLEFFVSLGFRVTFISILVGHVVLTVPYVARLTVASLQGIPPLLEVQAQTLGATPRQAVRLVTLPLIAASVFAGSAFAFLVSFDDVSVALFLSRPGITTLPVFVFNYAQQTSDPLVLSINSLLIVVALGFLVVLERTIGVRRLLG